MNKWSRLFTSVTRQCLGQNRALFQSAAENTLKYSPVAKSFEDIPGPRGLCNIPYLGFLFHLHPFSEYTIDDITQLHDHWYKEYGPLVKVKVGSTFQCHVFDPDDIATIYREAGKFPIRMSLPLNEAYYRRKNISPGLVVLNGEKWKEQRSCIQAAIQRPSVVRNYVPLLSNVADEFVEKFKGKTEIHDVYRHLLEFTTEGIGLLLFNKRLGCINSSNTQACEIMNHAEVLLDSFAEQFRKPPWYFWFRTKLYKNYEESLDFLNEIAHQSLQETLEKIQCTPEDDRSDLEASATMQLLIDHSSIDKVKTSLLELFAGGIDTTAGASTYVLLHLAKNPYQQEKLYQEVKQFAGQSLTAETIQKLQYLKACVKESFRMVYPVPGGPVRMLDKDINLSGYNIPKRTMLQICSGTICRDNNYFHDADTFLPERWLRDDASEKIHPFAFIPFGHGHRNCVGQRFAEIEIHILVAKLLQKYQFSLSERNNDLTVIYTTFSKPKSPVTLIIKER